MTAQHRPGPDASLWRRARFLSIAVPLLTTGCALFAEPAPPSPKSAQVDRQVKLVVRGARTADVDTKISMTFIARKSGGSDSSLSLASITAITPIPAGSGTVIPSIGMVGNYTGDGDYDLPAGSGDTPPAGVTRPPATSASSSTVAFTFFPTSTGSTGGLDAVRFGYLAKPCSLELEDDTQQGSLSCPEIVAADGKKISAEMTWKKP